MGKGHPKHKGKGKDQPQGKGRGLSKREEKIQRLRGSFRPRSDDDRRRLVEDLAPRGRPAGPPNQGGWVGIHTYVGDITREDAHAIVTRDEKDPLVMSDETDGAWVAAGHTPSGVIGPGRELPVSEVPSVLAHGSYARFTQTQSREKG